MRRLDEYTTRAQENVQPSCDKALVRYLDRMEGRSE